MHPLEKLIKARGNTVKSIAARAGIPPTTIYNVTGGRGTIGRMGVSQFIRIAHALDMTADDLIRELGMNHDKD